MECRVNRPRELIKPGSNRRDALQFLPSPTSSPPRAQLQYLDDPVPVSISTLFSLCDTRVSSGSIASRQSRTNPRLVVPRVVDARGASRDATFRKKRGENWKSEGSKVWSPRFPTARRNFPILINGARPKEATNAAAATLHHERNYTRELNLTNPHNTGPTALSPFAPCFVRLIRPPRRKLL